MRRGVAVALFVLLAVGFGLIAWLWHDSIRGLEDRYPTTTQVAQKPPTQPTPSVLGLPGSIEMSPQGDREDGGCGLFGVVADSTKAVVPDVVVELTGHRVDLKVRETQTGPTGQYSLDGIPPGVYDVSVVRLGRSQAVANGIALGSGQRLRLDLSVATLGRLTGTVRDQEDRPIQDAVVAISMPGSPQTLAETKSSADGEYDFGLLPSGAFTLSARTRDGAAGTSNPITILATDETHAELVLAPYGSLVGVVVDSAGEPPAAKLRVFAVLERDDGYRDASFAANVGPQGRYAIQLPAGVYRFQLQDIRGFFYTRFGKYFSIKASETTSIDITLKGEPVLLNGVVLDADGRPADEALVYLGPELADGGGSTQLTKTSGGGRFSFAVPQGEQGLKVLRASRGGAVTGSVPVQSEGTRSVELHLHSSRSVRGRLLGDPAPSAFVLRVRSSAWEGLLGVDELSFLGTTFECPDAPDSDLQLTARTSDGRVGTATLPADSEAPHEIAIALTPGATVVGRLVWLGSGEPVAQAVVTLDPNDEPTRVSSGADGSFRIPSVTQGQHRISITTPGLESTPQEILLTADRDTVDLGEVGVKGAKM